MKRVNSNRTFQMSIHGIAPKTGDSDTKVKKLTEDEEKIHNLALKDAMERKRIEFENKR